MKYSVVIPLYNKERYIARAIESVLAQTFRDFELIIINDGSMDGSELNVTKYTDERVRLVSQKNAGESAARNKGIALARGEYIAFLDADDAWKNNFLAEISRLIQIAPGCAVYATYFEVKEANGDMRELRREAIAAKIDSTSRLDYLGCLAEAAYPLSSSSICVVKHYLDMTGVFDTNLKIGADIDMWLRLCSVGSIAYSQLVCATYFRDAENRSTDQSNLAEKFLTCLQKMVRNNETLSLSAIDRINLRRFISQQTQTTAYLLLKAGQYSEAIRLVRGMGRFMSVYLRAKIVIKALIFTIKAQLRA
jgi:glycosyltransferase involved in cell wall biosynthesis